MVWRAVRRLGVPNEAAEDAAQEVFIVAARKIDTIEPGGEARFLYGVSLKVAANRRRASAVRHELRDEGLVQAAASERPDADALLDHKRMRQALDVVLDSLADELRAVLVMFELEGFSEREIAAICRVPLGTVASRLRRARAMFHEAAEALRQSVEASRGEP
jgi:RNA polymerase sigma-70 factor (ECF subfamily)